MKEQIADLIKIKGITKETIIDAVEIPKDKEMGDYALPCFSFAKILRKNPVEIAKDIADSIKDRKDFEKVEAINGYVNFFVNRKSLADEIIKEVLIEKSNYGKCRKNKERVMIEFSQPNTHKAFHIGHIRGTSLGESLARIMEFCGDKVVRANYSGDTGMHIAKWLWCYDKFHPKEKIRDDEKWFADIYVEASKKLDDNETGEREVEEINRKLDSREDKKLLKLWQETRKKSISSWKDIYKELDTKFDVHFFESLEEKRGKEIALELINKKIAKQSDEAVIVDFKEHGFDNLGVIVLLRGDGTVLYGAKDLALAEKKFGKYRIDRSIYVIGKAQDMHIHQVFKILELMKFKSDRYEYVPVNEVRFPWGKMSSRTGENILYADFRNGLIDEARKEIKKRYKLKEKEIEKRALAIAVSAMKYSMLKQDVNKGIIFNPKEEIRFEGNTGPYLLYSYARARSIIKKVGKKKSDDKDINIDKNEKKIISEIGRFGGVVERAYRERAPNIVANYSYELCRAFNEFYHAEKVIGSEKENFRLKIVESFSITLRNALHLLNIKVIEEM